MKIQLTLDIELPEGSYPETSIEEIEKDVKFAVLEGVTNYHHVLGNLFVTAHNVVGAKWSRLWNESLKKAGWQFKIYD